MLRLLSKVQSSTTACVGPVVPRMLRTAEVIVFWSVKNVISLSYIEPNREQTYGYSLTRPSLSKKRLRESTTVALSFAKMSEAP